MFTKGLIWGVSFLLFSYISAKLWGRVIMISDRIFFFVKSKISYSDSRVTKKNTLRAQRKDSN